MHCKVCNAISKMYAGQATKRLKCVYVKQTEGSAGPNLNAVRCQDSESSPD